MALEIAVGQAGQVLKHAFPIQKVLPRIIVGKYNNYHEICQLRHTLNKKVSNGGLFRHLRFINNKFYVSNINTFQNSYCMNHNNNNGENDKDNNNNKLELIPNSDLRYVYPIAKHVLNVWQQSLTSSSSSLSSSNVNNENYEVNVHVTRQISKAKSCKNNPLSNYPNYLHKNGSDFIMSALVLDLENVKGAVSSVCHENDEDTKLVEKQLGIGEYLIHDDKEYLHKLSLMESDDGENDAIRDVVSVYVTAL